MFFYFVLGHGKVTMIYEVEKKKIKPRVKASHKILVALQPEQKSL